MRISLSIPDKQLTEKFDKRQADVRKWYANFDKNFNRVLDEIEKRNPRCWNKRERKWIFNKYKKGAVK